MATSDCPRTDGFDQYQVKSCGVKHVDYRCSSARQPAGVPARRQRADKHAFVRLMLGHANAIAEHRAAGEWTRRINRNDRDGMSARKEFAEERIDQCRLARACGSGDADDMRTPQMRRQRIAHTLCAPDRFRRP